MKGLKGFDFNILELLARTNAEARPYQQRIVTKAVRGYTPESSGGKGFRSELIQSPTGCLTGDTEIVVNLGGKPQRFTMQEAFIHFHGGDPDTAAGVCLCGCGEGTKVPQATNRSKGQVGGVLLKFIHGHQSRAMKWENTPYVRSFRGENGLGLQKVVNVVRSGVKEVYRLHLSDGKVLKGTACHLVMTDRGWVPLGKLERGMKVMVDNVSYKKVDAHASKPRDKFIANLWNHPFGRRVATTKERRGHTIRIPMHVAVFEATANGLAMDEYVDTMRSGDPTGLVLVDPSTHVVHHKDGNHNNNSPDNLQLMTAMEHLQHHGDASHFGMSVPEWSSVAGVELLGNEMTYDVCCEQPYHNFVANGVVVHNSGKTIMALLAAKALQERLDCLIGWISMRRNLLAQAANENAKPSDDNPKGKGICADIEFISMFDKNPPDHLRPGIRKKPLLLIIDEAQHDAANSCAHLHATLQADLILGMTATPFRTDKVKLCFDTVINDAGIGPLIREGYLSQYEHYTILKWSVKEVMKTYLREPEKWGKSVFYFHTIAQCREAAEYLARPDLLGTEFANTTPVDTEVVTGDSDRDTQLKRFDDGNIKALINCQVLTEGWDCPDLETAFIRDSCKGVTIQMAGRVFRKHANVPLKKLVQSEKTAWPFVKTADPVCSYKWEPARRSQDGEELEGQWLSLTPNPHINEMNMKMLHALASVQTELPKFMTEAKFSQRGRSRRRRI